MIFKLEVDQRIIDGFCAKNFYSDTVRDDKALVIPNPESKEQFFQRLISEYIKLSVISHETNQAILKADTDFKAYVLANPTAIDLSVNP